MELEPWSRTALGLREYVREVAAELGCTGDAFLVQCEAPTSAYLPLAQQLYGFPDRDAALLWHHRHGWSAEVDDTLVVAQLGGDPVPPPDEVAAFVADLVAGLPGRRRPQTQLPDEVLCARLTAYAPALEHV